MADRLAGCVALITGASSGIGEATARALAAEGAKVAVTARRRERIEKLAEQIAGTGQTALAIESDIAVPEQAVAAVDRAVDAFGRLDILVNNAGVMLLGPPDEAPLEEWQRMVDVNVKGLLQTTHAALGHLLAAAKDPLRGVADLINISSVAGRVPDGIAAVYNLTKFGVTGFSEAMRQEIAHRGVRVTAIEPGTVATELTDHIRDGVREQVREEFAHIRPLTSEDIAETITYCVTRPAHVLLSEILILPTDEP